MKQLILFVIAGGMLTSISSGDDKDSADKTKEAPKEIGLVATLVVYEKTYQLKSEKAPAVKIDLIITNNTRADKTVHKSLADNVELKMKLKGPGAVFVEYKGGHMGFLRTVSPSKLAPGESVKFPIRSLVCGFRNTDYWAWRAPGTYTLEVSLVSKLQTITAPPVEITVVETEETRENNA